MSTGKKRKTEVCSARWNGKRTDATSRNGTRQPGKHKASSSRTKHPAKAHTLYRRKGTGHSAMTGHGITGRPVTRTLRSNGGSRCLYRRQSLSCYCPDKLMSLKQQARLRGSRARAKNNLQEKWQKSSASSSLRPHENSSTSLI